MIRRTHVALFALLGLARCAPVDALNAITPTGGVTITKNIAYGNANRQNLDIYRPNDQARHPIIMFIYGGAWNSGSKSMYPFVAATLARLGNVVVVPDYRLYPEVQYPVFLQDCAQAFAWTAGHAANLQGDGKIFLMGHSAGAYNAAMLALDPSLLEAAGTSTARITGFIGLAGPYDFLPIVDPEVIAVFKSRDNPATQPVNYVHANVPPMFLAAGARDTTVRPKNTISLADHVHKVGGQAQVKIYPGLGHIGLILAIAPAFQWTAPVLADIASFIRAQAGQNATAMAQQRTN
jgi:acetyl esterase/lipase